MLLLCLFKEKELWGENMKKISSKLKKFFSKKPVMVILVVLSIIAIVIAIYFMFFFEKNTEITYEDYTIATGHYGKVEEYDPSFTVDGYKGDKEKAYYITGNITAQETKSFTIITFNLYDKQNTILGTAVAGLNEVKKGKSYEFKALSLIENKDIQKIDHYKIKTIDLGTKY